jgi:hypothetical protein
MAMRNEQRGSRKRRISSVAAAGNGTEGLRAEGVLTRNVIVRVARKLVLERGPIEFSEAAIR